MGHAFNIGHSSPAYEKGTYPYINGGLDGSEWGYDSINNVFLDVYRHGTMNATTGCKANESRTTKDALGRCYKGDPMAGGQGSRDAGQPFQIFSDYHAARMQKYFEGGSSASGKIFYDEAAEAAGAFPFVRWDPRIGAFVRQSRSSSSIRSRMASRGVYPS